jgi:hypothetical protein
MPAIRRRRPRVSRPIGELLMNLEVLEFTRRALDKGVSRERVASALKQAGWSEPDIRAAAGAFADIDFPVPVPRPRPHLSAQEVFIYLLFFTTLSMCAFNLGALIFQLIDLYFPDATRGTGVGLFGNIGGDRRSVIDQAMRGNISALIVAFPVFLFLFRTINVALRRDPTKRQSGPRKWLTYLALFVTASTLIGDFSSLIYNLLGGELATPFLLKSATVAIISGGVFGYFFVDVRKDDTA